MTHDEKLAYFRLQRENIELKGMVLGSQLREIDNQIALLEAWHPATMPAVSAAEELAHNGYINA